MLNIPSTLIENYRIASNSKYSLLTRIDCIWVIYQFFALFPLVYFSLHRFKNQIIPERYINNPKQILPNHSTEYFVKFSTIIFAVFYFPQLILRLFIKMDSSNILWIVHHLVTFYGAYNFLRCEYFPWFTIGPWAFHSLLWVMPTSTSLYYPYIILIIICYQGCGIEPYKFRKGYQQIRYYILMLSFVLVIMWATGYTNEINVQ